MIFKGNDDGSVITALTLDMSAAGAATFNNDVTAFSDNRFKEDITTIPDALDKVCKLRGVTYNRIDIEKYDERHMGVIAQEVEKVIPEVVKTDKSKEKIKSVAYGNLVGVLIEAIKELKAEIEELKHDHKE
jgi:chromosomal replication initiation ATPase DnaA